MNNNNLMEIFYLETPSLERKKEIIDYINEFVEYKSDINGTDRWIKYQKDILLNRLQKDV